MLRFGMVDDALKLGADQRTPPAAHAACRESFGRVSSRGGIAPRDQGGRRPSARVKTRKEMRKQWFASRVQLFIKSNSAEI